MTKLDKALERYACNAEYERAHGNLQGCLEFKQLCEWLKELRAYRKMYHKEHKDDYLRAKSEVLDKIIDVIEMWHKDGTNWSDIRLMDIEEIVKKYKSESEEWVNFADDLIPIIDEAESEDKE